MKPTHDVESAVLNFKMGKQSIERLNSISVAEASRFFPGLQVKDYGGLGGLKTVSLRSLGASYTTVLYNGIPLVDAQGGQIDLGRFSLMNVEAIELSLQLPAQNLAPARAFANAAMINIRSEVFDTAFSLKTGLQAGSFQTFQPFVSVRTKLSRKTAIQIYGDWQTSKGRYPFADYENNGTHRKRSGADISAMHGEITLTHKFNDSTYISWQNYYYTSDRGLPGAIIYFANPVSDRLKNQSLFSQIQWKTFPAKKFAMLSSFKYAVDDKHYADPDYPNSAGRFENDFQQTSAYGSVALEWMSSKKFSVHYALDYVWDKLIRKDSFSINFASPIRNTVIQNAGVVWKRHSVKLQADLLHTLIKETVTYGEKSPNRSEVAPTFTANIRFHDVCFRGSFKYLYRYPGFDELYFTNVGNTGLKPERGRLYNLGVLGEKNDTGGNLKINWSVDGYYQRLSDKILAIPRQNLFQWSMMNIGKASIYGADMFFSAGLLHQHSQYSLSVNYSFQKALDVSDPASISYKKQLAYSAVHSGSVRCSYGNGRIYAGYNLLFSGSRYRAGGELKEDRIDGFLLHDLYAGCSFFQQKIFKLSVKLEANNIFDHQYEIIRFYPMPGRNFRIGFILEHKNLKHKK
jgi:outer membrane cobalamin receptor